MRAKRVDDNHDDIVQALRAAGAFVRSLAAVGDGMPDLLVTKNSRTLLIECKNGAKSPSKRVLTPEQQKFHREWTGGPLAIVTDVDGALRALAML